MIVRETQLISAIHLLPRGSLSFKPEDSAEIDKHNAPFREAALPDMYTHYIALQRLWSSSSRTTSQL